MTAGGQPVSRTCVVVLSILALAGCTRLPSGSQTPSGTGGQTAETSSIETIVAPLRKAPDLANCRTVLQQVNAHLSAVPADMPQHLDETEAASLRQSFQLADEELAEIGSLSFTLLDGHHLEQCLVLSDAARSLEVYSAPPEVRAAAAFAWTMRQVQLLDEEEELVPPLAVLRRGWGTSTQRGLVFLAMLEQLDVPGCVIVLPGARQPWLVGALAGKQVMLFDPRLGFPLPGAAGRGIATLAQLRERPDLLAPLAGLGYDVAPAQVRDARPLLLCSLSALAPRMRLLQQSLGDASRVRFACDVPGLHRQFKAALTGPGMEEPAVRFLPGAGNPLAPVRLLRAFLNSEEGGADDTRWRQRRWELTLTPWDALPPVVRKVPENIEPGVRLRNLFEQPFLEMIQKAGQPRDLLIRGRLADSVARLVEGREEVQRYVGALSDESGLSKDLAVWCAEAERLHGDLLLARRQAANNPANQAALEQAEQQMAAHWKKWDRIRQAVLGAAATPLVREIDYFLALAKHEQAERAQARVDLRAEPAPAAREAWESAAERWQRSLDHPVSAWSIPGACLNRAQALEMLGQRDTALTLLESAAGKQPGWNEKALRYAIQQMKAR